MRVSVILPSRNGAARYSKIVVHVLAALRIILIHHQEDCLLLHPFKEGSQFIVYDSSTHTATLEDDQALAHPASYANASRVTTYLRGGVEQMHGGMKQTYEV